MRAFLVGQTKTVVHNIVDATDGRWEPEDVTGADLAEFAGRACYQSWGRPNPKTATNAGYIEHILEVEHTSVLEHGTVTFYIDQVSRSLTHEIVRHRHLSPSQLSQRFVVVKKTEHADDSVPYVTPPLLRGSSRANAVLSAAWDYAVHAYENLIEEGNRIVGDYPDMTATSSAKAVREAARAVLPNMTPTAIVLTGNHRAWRHFIDLRASVHADAEICELAVEVYHQLNLAFPAIYQDCVVHNDGRRDWVCVGCTRGHDG